MTEEKTKVVRKTTSIKINPDLWKEVKKYCIDKDMDISDMLENLLRKELKTAKGKQPSSA
ncbi:MAG: hypothetical protein QT00_C0001G0393 [archaeon GW2011_AR5]|nr:MAG: hypothetical protein QT00_C0001G0393 [archaeon GW2011_AR5]